MNRLFTFLNLIKFEHSIFALPFAYLGLFLAEHGFPRGRIFLWVTAAMVAIRTAAMCLNRLIDEPIDGKNPRTKGRVLAIQSIKRKVIWLITFCSFGLFIFAAAALNPLCLKLSPVPIALVWIYPYLKRMTWAAHFWLGAVLGIAPYAGWLAARPEWSWLPLLLTLAVWAWVSGFDMFYALQDVDFDHTNGLQSFPVRFGVQMTLRFVQILHFITVASLAVFGFVAHFGVWYWAGLLACVGFILKEHWMVNRFGVQKIDEAFFNMNAWVSVVIFIATMLDLTFSHL